MKKFARLVVLAALLFNAYASIAEGPDVDPCHLLGICSTTD